jgi:hypothetical protein
MTWRAEIPYDRLPRPITESITEASLLWACANPEADTVVLWTGTDRRREREFSPADGSFLTRSERERALPARREFVLSEQGIRVVQENSLLPDSDIRYERYVAYDSWRDSVITECGQKFFGPVYQDPEAVVADAVRGATFPERYRTEWSRSERISHWALWLNRVRRWAGEDGHDEDTAFTPDVWRRMREVDPDVEELLPEIIDELAKLWMTDPARMLSDFRRRAGV